MSERFHHPPASFESARWTLPFYRPEARRHGYWSVKPTGDELIDKYRGHLYALALLRHIAEHGRPESWTLSVLSDLVESQGGKGLWRCGVERSFVELLAEVMNVAVRQPGFLQGLEAKVHKAYEADRESHRHYEEQDRLRRIEDGRRAAQIRWQKWRERQGQSVEDAPAEMPQAAE